MHQKYSDEEVNDLQLPILLAFDSIKSGKATINDYSTLATPLAVVGVLSEDIHPECVFVANKAIEGMVRCLERFQKLGKWGFDGQALQDIPVVIDIHEQFVRLLLPVQMVKALNKVIKMRS
jgi:hypothetical protein